MRSLEAGVSEEIAALHHDIKADGAKYQVLIIRAERS